MEQYNEQALRALISGGENERVELKESARVKDDALAREVCALANSLGGCVLIGVADDGTIVGSELSNERRATLAAAIASIEPRPQYSLLRVMLEGKPVWVIAVEEGLDKPYILGGSFPVRDEAMTAKLTRRADIRALFERNSGLFFDQAPADVRDLEQHLDAAVVERLRHISPATKGLSDRELLSNLHLLRPDGLPTRAAVLLCHKRPQDLFPHAAVHCALFKGRNKTQLLDDHLYEGPLPALFDLAAAWLKNHLSVQYIIEDGQRPRRELWDVPLDALYEALLNALIHRDYFDRGALATIDLYADRLVIANPGGVVPLVAQHFGQLNYARNPLLFEGMHRLGLVERVGSGIGRMRDAMAAAGLPEPEFELNGFFVVTLRRRARQ